MMQASGGNGPGNGVRVIVDTWSTRVGYVDVVRFLASLQGLLTHYDRGGSVACTEPEAKCVICKRLPTRWKGYAPAERWDEQAQHWQPVVYEATSGWEETIRGRNLRGEVWQLGKVKAGGRHAALKGLLVEQLDPSTVRRPFDIEPVLCRLYNVTSLNLGVVNVTQPRHAEEVMDTTPPRLPEGLQAPAPEELTAETFKKTFQRLRQNVGAMPGPRPAGMPGPRQGENAGQPPVGPSSNGKH